MKKIFTFLSVALVALWACAATNAGPAQKFTKFEGAHITGIDIGSAFEVTIEQGAVAKAEFEVSSDWIDRVKIELNDDGVLDVSVDHNWSKSRNPVLKLKLTCETLEKIDASGAVTMKVVGAFATNKLSVDASGASNVEFKAPVSVSGKAKVDASGASVVKAIGSAGSVEAEASGASTVNVSGLTTERAECDASGASSIDAFASVEATGEASGASSVKVAGGGRLSFRNVSGASSVRAK